LNLNAKLIGYKAFSNCTSLTSITISSGVTNIYDSVFSECTSLSSVTIPNNVKTIGSAFEKCYSLTSVTIENGVTNIDGTFYDCSGLTRINSNVNGVFNIPNTVTIIDNGAFYNCSGLTSITIPNSVTSIDNGAFKGCTSLSSITSNATTAPTISASTFQNVHTGGTLTVPSGSNGYDVWMGTGNYYLGKYNWTKVEQ
jgi:hypothetical protein